jgi:hypothetical protein
VLGRWNAAGAFAALTEHGELCGLLSAVMIERQVLVCGSQLAKVAGVAMLLMELIRPFA